MRKEEEAEEKEERTGTIDDLYALAIECAKFPLLHNAEPDAVDLLEELEIAEHLVGLVDNKNYARVCRYMHRYVFLKSSAAGEGSDCEIAAFRISNS